MVGKKEVQREKLKILLAAPSLAWVRVQRTKLLSFCKSKSARLDNRI
jgi:hypothetical protein